MSFGKMSFFIKIVSIELSRDGDGFTDAAETVLASVRAYKEDRHGGVRWANLAAFADASAMFRFRKIPSVAIDTTLRIRCGNDCYKILSAEDVRGRGMYVEVLAEKIEPSTR